MYMCTCRGRGGGGTRGRWSEIQIDNSMMGVFNVCSAKTVCLCCHILRP